ncbi:MAG TPA: type II toxin-antitoxin system RelE/ParE family toxin [Acidobacteriaceae bacterium]|nr:type II toxin-antitoxin system RelE/ParE family toxin [Acidobacteriaceae bacterium]
MADELEIHPEALREITSAIAWYQARSESAASRFVDEIDSAINLIVQSPARWPSGKHGTRRFILQRFPFALVYRVIGAQVQVLAAAHAHRRPGYWHDRL